MPSSTKTKKTITASFTKERDTKRFVRFAEIVEDGVTPAIGMLYVSKAALAAATGSEDASALSVTISVVTADPVAPAPEVAAA